MRRPGQKDDTVRNGAAAGSLGGSEDPAVGLTPRQARFVALYASGSSAAAAAREAGYSERSARQIAHELLTNPDIRAAVRERLMGLGMDALEATTLLFAQARGILPTRVRETLDRDGKPVELREFDTQRALTKVARILGLYERHSAGNKVMILRHPAELLGHSDRSGDR